MPIETKLLLGLDASTNNIDVTLEQNGTSDTVNFNVVLTPQVEAPTVPDGAGSVTVGGSIIISPLSFPGASGVGREIVSVTTPDNGDGVTSDVVAIINGGTQIGFTANGSQEIVPFDYTVRTGSGVPPDGDDVTGTITVVKQAEEEAGDGTLTITLMVQVGDIQNDEANAY